MTWLSPVVLSGPHARLEPLSHDHAEGLRAATRDGELWKLWYTAVPSPEGMAAEIDRRLGLQSRESMLPWTVFDANGRVVEMCIRDRSSSRPTSRPSATISAHTATLCM